MNVLLINPGLSYDESCSLIHPPLGLGMLSAMLKKHGHKVDFIDMPIDSMNQIDLKNILKNYDPGVIGISVLTETYIGAREAAMVCKEYYKTVPIVMGGPHVTFVPFETLERIVEVDYVLMYEGEYSFLELIDAIEGKKEITSIKNLGYRYNGKIIINPIDDPIECLDTLPRTDRSIFDMKKYLDRDIETIVLSARGCPGKCNFCATSKMGRKLRTFSINRLCDEIEECISMGFQSFFIADDTFGFSNERVKMFNEEIKNRRLDFAWTSNIRIVDINEERIGLMKEAGAYRVFTGIETINNNSSTIINKNINQDKIKGAIEILKKKNMQVHGSFIIGSPGDTDETMDSTIDFIKEIKPDIITLNSIRLYPGTDMFNNPENYGLYLEDKRWYENNEWTKRTVCGTKELSGERIDFWTDKIMKEFVNQYY